MLKKRFCLAAAVTLAACSTETYEFSDNKSEMSDVPVSFTTEILTRVANNVWENGDQIGVYMLTADAPLSDESVYDNSANSKYVYENNTFAPATELDRLYYPAASPVDFIAYYPFDNVAEDYTLSLNTLNQRSQSELDLLYSDNLKNVSATQNVQTLTFKHMLSKLVFNVTAGDGYEPSDLENLTLTVRNVQTDGVFSLATGEVNIEDGAEFKNVSSLISSKEASIVGEVIVLPQTCAGTQVVIALASGDGYVMKLTTEGNMWLTGCKYTYDIVLSKNQETEGTLSGEITDWSEEAGETSPFDIVPWNGEVNTEWYSASKSSYEILTPEEFAGLATLVNEGTSFEGKTINLLSDLDMGNQAWTPVGLSLTTPFVGTFDGGNHKISNLNVAMGDSANIGLFGVSKGTIRNMAVDGTYTVSSTALKTISVGAVCGLNIGTVENTRNYATIHAQMDVSDEGSTTILYVGGLVGRNSLGTILNSQNYGVLTSTNINAGANSYVHLGGISGTNECVIEGCENTRNLTAKGGNVRLGGIVALSNNGTNQAEVKNNINIGDLTVTEATAESSVGGIVGRNQKCSVISGATNKGDVLSKLSSGTIAYAGGIVAYNDSASVVNVENKGNIDAVGVEGKGTAATAGGIIGYHLDGATLHQGTNYGYVTATVAENCFAGGLVGYNKPNGTKESVVYNCCTNEGVPAEEIGNSDVLTTDCEEVH